MANIVDFPYKKAYLRHRGLEITTQNLHLHLHLGSLYITPLPGNFHSGRLDYALYFAQSSPSEDGNYSWQILNSHQVGCQNGSLYPQEGQFWGFSNKINNKERSYFIKY